MIQVNSRRIHTHTTFTGISIVLQICGWLAHTQIPAPFTLHTIRRLLRNMLRISHNSHTNHAGSSITLSRQIQHNKRPAHQQRRAGSLKLSVQCSAVQIYRHHFTAAAVKCTAVQRGGCACALVCVLVCHKICHLISIRHARKCSSISESNCLGKWGV